MKEHFHTLYFRDFCQFESWKKRPFAETVSGGSHNLVCAHFALARQKALSETLRSHQREVGANEVARFFRPSELSRLRIFLSTRGLNVVIVSASVDSERSDSLKVDVSQDPQASG